MFGSQLIPKLRNRVLLLVLFMAASGWLVLNAQQNPSDALSPYTDGKPNLAVTDELQVGAIFHTQGLGVTFRRGNYVNPLEIKQFGADLAYFKHPKEIRTSNPIYENGRPYVYGKQNTLQMLRLWFGKQSVLALKSRKNGVRYGAFWKVGCSAGILKPVYLEIGYPDIPYDYVATERYDPDLHFSDNIYGMAAWSNGLDELKVVPGFHASYALDFEYGTERYVPKTLSTGVSFDGFLVAPEIFADKFEQNNRFFVTLFATFEVGRNWRD